MKLTYTSANGRFSVQFEGDQKDIFNEIASFQEIFEHSKCGKCGSEEIKFVVRRVEDNEYPELHCQNIKCRSRFTFGQHKKGGTLFPKKKDGENNWLPNGGWTKYNTQTGKEE